MGFLKALFQMPAYSRFLLLGDSSKGCYWSYDTWRVSVFPELDALLKFLGCAPSVHCRQITRVGSKNVKFGKIEWSIESAKKWCHDSPVTGDQSQQWIFIDLQLFCPGKDLLVKAVEFPKLYVQLKPMVWEGTESRTIYDQAIHVAVKSDTYVEMSDGLEERIESLANAAAAVAVYRGKSRVASLNAFESLVREDFMYRGILEDRLPDVTKMKGKWSKWSRSEE